MSFPIISSLSVCPFQENTRKKKQKTKAWLLNCKWSMISVSREEQMSNTDIIRLKMTSVRAHILLNLWMREISGYIIHIHPSLSPSLSLPLHHLAGWVDFSMVSTSINRKAETKERQMMIRFISGLKMNPWKSSFNILVVASEHFISDHKLYLPNSQKNT